MIDKLSRNPGSVYLFLGAYCLVNFLVRMIQPASLELDEGQQLFAAQWLASGYDSQPPFYNWLQWGAVQLLGSTVAALSLLKNLMVFGCFVFFGLAAHLVIRDRTLAVVATLGLLTIPQISYAIQRDLTHTVAVLFAACMFFYAFLLTLQRPSLWSYALVGVSVGIGVISKYNFALLPVAAAIAAFTDPVFRRRLFDWRVLISLLLAVVIALPHAIWFLSNVKLATAKTFQKMETDADISQALQIAEGSWALLAAIVVFLFSTWAIFAATFGSTFLRSWNAESDWTRLIERMMYVILAALVLVVIFAGASTLRNRWLVPFLFLLPIYFCAKIEASGRSFGDGPRRFGMVILAIAVIIPSVLLLRTPLMGVNGNYVKLSVPYGPAVQAILKTDKNPPSVILAADQQLAGNIRLESEAPVIVPGYLRLAAPLHLAPGQPVLVIWRGGEQPRPMTKALGRLVSQISEIRGLPIKPQTVSLPYHFGKDGDQYLFHYAWIYPQGVARAD